MKNSGPFRLKAGEFRDRAQSADSPLARQRLEDAARRFDNLADEIDGSAVSPQQEQRVD
jgi:hypothetical protein